MVQSSLYVVILLISVQVVFSIVSPEVMKACQKESGFEGDISNINFKESSVSKEAKCYLACTMDSLKLLNEDGTIKQEEVFAVIEKIAKGDEELKQKLTKNSKECLAEVKFTADKCNNAFEYVKCKKEKFN